MKRDVSINNSRWIPNNTQADFKISYPVTAGFLIFLRVSHPIIQLRRCHKNIMAKLLFAGSNDKDKMGVSIPRTLMPIPKLKDAPVYLIIGENNKGKVSKAGTINPARITPAIH